jgi:hypothetical protein
VRDPCFVASRYQGWSTELSLEDEGSIGGAQYNNNRIQSLHLTFMRPLQHTESSPLLVSSLRTCARGDIHDRFIAISQNCFSRRIHLSQTANHSAYRAAEGGSAAARASIVSSTGNSRQKRRARTREKHAHRDRQRPLSERPLRRNPPSTGGTDSLAT